LSLQSIDNIHGSDSLPLGMFSVGDSITDDVLKEDLEDTSGLFIDEARDTLDTSTASQTADSGLGDTLDVITQNFAMTLGASLAESFSSFASSSHVECFLFELSKKNDASTPIAAAFILMLELFLLGSAGHMTRLELCACICLSLLAHTKIEKSVLYLSQNIDSEK
jgi:hypothetical protein